MAHKIERNRIYDPAQLGSQAGIRFVDGDVEIRDCMIVLGGGNDWRLGLRAGEMVELDPRPYSSLYMVVPRTWLQKLALSLLFKRSAKSSGAGR